ncbi:FecR family protein [Oceanibacterium hippocampi]|uniref:FecR protein n=1 Tax=Oceanibacterium hippocampi TaxID=745714 RepID=A0A1Y5TEY7_9PROT|nr:FecR domain-containing protein [Oceanibacterium hippocampi]SLN58792.1 FecR protein [Oceanibacterium hippocampi]
MLFAVWRPGWSPSRSMILCAAVVGLCLAAATCVRADEAAIGRVIKQVGNVVAMRNGTTRALHIGADVHAGDRIVTPARSRVKIEFADSSIISIGASTDLELVTPTDPGRGRGVFSLISGIVRMLLMPSDERDGFDIETRTAVASVRSTEWMIEAADDSTAVVVLAGRVVVAARASGQDVLLGPGIGTDQKGDMPPSAPKKWGAKRVAAFIERTTVE